MKTYSVAMARIEHHVYRFEVEADSQAEAEEKAKNQWDDGDYPDQYEVVHAEEFLVSAEEAK
jgi:hypothetical protein